MHVVYKTSRGLGEPGCWPLCSKVSATIHYHLAILLQQVPYRQVVQEKAPLLNKRHSSRMPISVGLYSVHETTPRGSTYNQTAPSSLIYSPIKFV